MSDVDIDADTGRDANVVRDTDVVRDAAVAEPTTEARERHLELTQEIDEHQYRYYVLDSPSVDDATYDSLIRELEALEERVLLDHDAQVCVSWPAAFAVSTARTA